MALASCFAPLRAALAPPARLLTPSVAFCDACGSGAAVCHSIVGSALPAYATLSSAVAHDAMRAYPSGADLPGALTPSRARCATEAFLAAATASLVYDVSMLTGARGDAAQPPPPRCACCLHVVISSSHGAVVPFVRDPRYLGGAAAPVDDVQDHRGAGPGAGAAVEGSGGGAGGGGGGRAGACGSAGPAAGEGSDGGGKGDDNSDGGGGGGGAGGGGGCGAPRPPLATALVASALQRGVNPLSGPRCAIPSPCISGAATCVVCAAAYDARFPADGAAAGGALAKHDARGTENACVRCGASKGQRMLVELCDAAGFPCVHYMCAQCALVYPTCSPERLRNALEKDSDPLSCPACAPVLEGCEDGGGGVSLARVAAATARGAPCGGASGAQRASERTRRGGPRGPGAALRGAAAGWAAAGAAGGGALPGAGGAAPEHGFAPDGRGGFLWRGGASGSSAALRTLAFAPDPALGRPGYNATGRVFSAAQVAEIVASGMVLVELASGLLTATLAALLSGWRVRRVYYVEPLANLHLPLAAWAARNAHLLAWPHGLELVWLSDDVRHVSAAVRAYRAAATDAERAAVVVRNDATPEASWVRFAHVLPHVAVGGPPCQSHSGANTGGGGLADESGGLTLDVADVLRFFAVAAAAARGDPQATCLALLENVTGMSQADTAAVSAAVGLPHALCVASAGGRAPQLRRRRLWTTVPLGVCTALPSHGVSLRDLIARRLDVPSARVVFLHGVLPGPRGELCAKTVRTDGRASVSFAPGAAAPSGKWHLYYGILPEDAVRGVPLPEDARRAPPPRAVPVCATVDMYLLVQGFPADFDVRCIAWAPPLPRTGASSMSHAAKEDLLFECVGNALAVPAIVSAFTGVAVLDAHFAGACGAPWVYTCHTWEPPGGAAPAAAAAAAAAATAAVAAATHHHAALCVQRCAARAAPAAAALPV